MDINEPSLTHSNMPKTLKNRFRLDQIDMNQTVRLKGRLTGSKIFLKTHAPNVKTKTQYNSMHNSLSLSSNYTGNINVLNEA